MNAVAIMYVNEYLESLRAEAHAQRVASLAGQRSLRDRLASGAANLLHVLGYEAGGPSLPPLKDYPYGG